MSEGALALKDVARLRAGRSPREVQDEAVAEEAVPYVRLGDVRDDDVEVRATVRLAASEAPGATEALPGALLVGLSATGVRVVRAPQPVYVGAGWVVLDDLREDIDPEWLLGLLRQRREEIHQLGVGSVRLQLSAEALARLTLAVPSRRAQTRAASIVRRAWEIADLRREADARLDALTRALRRWSRDEVARHPDWPRVALRSVAGFVRSDRSDAPPAVPRATVPDVIEARGDVVLPGDALIPLDEIPTKSCIAGSGTLLIPNTSPDADGFRARWLIEQAAVVHAHALDARDDGWRAWLFLALHEGGVELRSRAVVSQGAVVLTRSALEAIEVIEPDAVTLARACVYVARLVALAKVSAQSRAKTRALVESVERKLFGAMDEPAGG